MPNWQRIARVFLIRNRMYWARIRGALVMQGAWRGYATRKAHSELVQHLQSFRENAAKMKFFQLVFAAFKVGAG